VSRLFGTLSARTQGVLFILLTGSLVAGAWRGWLAPDRLLLETRRSKLAASNTERARLRMTAAGLPGLQREVRALEAKLAALKWAGQQSAGTEPILQALDDLATRSGVDIAAFTAVRAPNEKDPGQRFDLGLEGSFNGILTFLDGLVSLGRIGSIVEVTVKPQTKATAPPAVAATVIAAVREGAAAVPASGSALESGASLKRDPFLDPTIGSNATPRDARSPTNPGTTTGGLAGLSVDDVSVTGIVREGNRMTAVLQGTNRQTFVATTLDRLLDATITSIDEAGVVFARKTPKKPEVIRKSLGKIAGAVR
jgi:Tfp pilus assembly protein PilO